MRGSGRELPVMVLLQAGEKDGGKAPADASAIGTPAERHATARRGLRRSVTSSEGLAAVGVAMCGAEGRTAVVAACEGRTDCKTVSPGGGCSRTHRATSETVEVSRRPVGVRYWRQGCQPGARRGPGARLPVCGWRKTGSAPPTTVQRPRSGSTKVRARRSRPSKAGEGREAVGSGSGSASGVTSSKGKRGSGKWSRVFEMRVAPVLGIKQTWER